MGLEKNIGAALGEGFLLTKFDDLINWGRKNSLWPYPYGTACCAIEMMATLSTKYDLARFGAEAVRFSPRQADVMLVASRIVVKMVPVIQQIWEQMSEPKYLVAMGACSIGGGIFDTYSVVQGIDKFLPVDVYVPGCPPRPEDVIDAIMAIQRKIEKESVLDEAR